MEPINIIIYYSDKELQKRLHFLEADMITRFEVSSSKTEELRSAHRIHLLEHMFQMPQTHLKPTFLKDHVYENHPQSSDELKVAITQKIRAIRKEECQGN